MDRQDQDSHSEKGETLDVKVTEQDKWTRTVEVQVPYDELVPEIEKGYRKYQKKVKVQGFRPGKVPLPMIKRMYGPRIEVEVIEDLIPKIVTEAWKQENLKIVSLPRVENLDFQPGSDLRVTFTVDVEPEFELKKIDGFKFNRQVYQVSDEEVERVLERLRDQHAVWENVDGEVEEDHYVLVDLQELDQSGVPVVGRKAENQLLAMKNEEGQLNAFLQPLLGARVGDKRIIEVLPRAESGDEPLEPVKYETTIKEIKRKILPELDDEFAKDVGEYESLDELRQQVRKDLQNNVQKDLDHDLDHQIIDEIIKSNPFDIPNSMVDTYLDEWVNRIKSQTESEGEPLDEEKIREEYRPIAIWNIKWRLIRDKLLEQYELAPTMEELEAEVARIAESKGEDPKRLWNRVKNNPDTLEQLRYDLSEKKVLDFLKSRQKIKETKVSRKDFEKKSIITQ